MYRAIKTIRKKKAAAEGQPEEEPLIDPPLEELTENTEEQEEPLIDPPLEELTENTEEQEEPLDEPKKEESTEKPEDKKANGEKGEK